jgi:hypothetical protein
MASIFMSFVENSRKQTSFIGKEIVSLEQLEKKGVGIESLSFNTLGVGLNIDNIGTFISTHDFYLYAKPKGLDIAIPDEKKEDIVTVLGEIFEDTNTDASILVSSSNMRIGEVRAEKKIIANELSKTSRELERYKEKTVARNYETKHINGSDYMLVPTEKNTTVIDGVEYVLVPVKDSE